MKQKNLETGRSMVEMLGTLAIMGVLSVGAIAGFNYAMNKHRTNEILDEARKRAYTVMTQTQLGLTQSLSEYSRHNTFAGGTFGSDIVTEGLTGQFGLQVTGVLGRVCNNLKDTVSENTIIRKIKVNGTDDGDCNSEGNALVLVYNNDMSQVDTTSGGGSGEGGEMPVDCSTNSNACSGCQTCQDGVCKNTNTSCPNNGTCTNGRCSDCPKGDACGTQCCADGTYCTNSGVNYTCVASTGGNCAKNSDCNNGNMEGSKYCEIKRESSVLKGTCKSTSDSDLVPVSYNGKTIYAGPKMNWWSAENFCLAHGKKLPSLSSLGMSTNYNSCSTCTEETCTLDPMIRMMGGCSEDETDLECMKYRSFCISKSGYGGPLHMAFSTAGIESGMFWTSTAKGPSEAWEFEGSSRSESVSALMRTTGNIFALCE